MPQKSWKISHKSFDIEFVNSYTLSGECTETLYVNDDPVVTNHKSMRENSRREMTSAYLSADVMHENTPHLVAVKAGTKWHRLSTCCHIFVDGELVGGDINSKIY